MAVRILLADDAPSNRRLMMAVLKKIEDVEFVEAQDGGAAMDIISTLSIDLVILDLSMPVLSGFKILELMRSAASTSDIPVIIYSAQDAEDSIRQGLELGAYDYLTKPLSMEQIKTILPLKARNALREYRLRQSLTSLNNRMQDEINLAKKFLEDMIPRQRTFFQATMWGAYYPSSELGGDYYDCLTIGDEVWMIVADVSGHGVAAAMFVSMIRVAFNDVASYGMGPAEVMGLISTRLYNLVKTDDYFTAFIAVLRQGGLEYCNAGHPYPLVVDCTANEVSVLAQPSNPAAMFLETVYTTQRITFAADKYLLCYTDGLLDLWQGVADSIEETIGALAQRVTQEMSTLLESPDKFLQSLRQNAPFQEKRGVDDFAAMLVSGR